MFSRTRRLRRRIGTASTLVVLGAVGALAIPTPALAHVTVTPESAGPGAFTTLAFRVPNERDDASTVRVEIFFPSGSPLAHASVRPVPGWTVSTRTKKLDRPISTDDGKVTQAVSGALWRGGAIEPGQFQEFELSVGPLPDKATTLVFKVLQTYSNGAVARWIELPAAGGVEPEHPAPILTVAAAASASGAASHDEGAADSPKAGGAAEVAEADRPAATQDVWARWIAGTGVLVGLLGLVAGLLGRRRPAPTPPSAADPDIAGVPTKVRTAR